MFYAQLVGLGVPILFEKAPSEVFARKSIGDTSLHIPMHGGARQCVEDY